MINNTSSAFLKQLRNELRWDTQTSFFKLPRLNYSHFASQREISRRSRRLIRWWRARQRDDSYLELPSYSQKLFSVGSECEDGMPVWISLNVEVLCVECVWNKNLPLYQEQEEQKCCQREEVITWGGRRSYSDVKLRGDGGWCSRVTTEIFAVGDHGNMLALLNIWGIGYYWMKTMAQDQMTSSDDILLLKIAVVRV